MYVVKVGKKIFGSEFSEDKAIELYFKAMGDKGDMDTTNLTRMIKAQLEEKGSFKFDKYVITKE